jgi:hypothetical protein
MIRNGPKSGRGKLVPEFLKSTGGNSIHARIKPRKILIVYCINAM